MAVSNERTLLKEAVSICMESGESYFSYSLQERYEMVLYIYKRLNEFCYRFAD